jgi:hypothetical protein
MKLVRLVKIQCGARNHPVFNLLLIILHTQYIQSLMQLKILFILILTRHVLAAVGRHPVFLLKLFHCNFYI